MEGKQPIIWAFILCFNEIELLPFAVEYWKRNFDHVVVLDNHSNDGSVEYLQQFDFVEIRPYESNDKVDDEKYRSLKNNAWKTAKGKCDWVFVGDMDEFLWTIPDLHTFVAEMDKKDETVLQPQGYQMYSDVFPEYHEGELLHQQCYKGEKFDRESKKVLFNINKIHEINYDAGAHNARPRGVVKYHLNQDAFLLHYKMLSEDYLVNKYKLLNNRLSANNKKHRWGSQYMKKESEIREGFRKGMSNAIDLRDKL